MLPQSRSYEELVREFRWQLPAQFNIGVEVCDRWAERDPDKLAIVAVDADGRAQDMSYGWLRDTSNRLANALAAHGIGRGDRVAILLPQAPEVAAIHIAIYKLGGIALPLATLFGTDALVLPPAEFRRQGARSPTPRGSPRSPRSGATAGACRPSARSCRSTAPGDGALGICADAGARVVGIRAGCDRGRRSGADGLHLRHHRPAQGRAARPSRADRPHAGDRAAARFLSAARRPVLDAGGLGLGRRPARLPVAEPLLRRAGGGAPVRQVRSGGGVRADGAARRAQRLHPADRAAHAARGAEPARPPRFDAALGRLRRRGAGRRDLRMGQVGARRRDQRVLRPDRMQPGGRLLRLDRRGAARRHRQGHPRPHRGGDRRATARRAEAGRDRPDRGQAAGPGDVPGILGPAGGDAREIHRRLDDHRRPGRRGRARATSPSSAATTTSSPRRAIASGRARSRIA